MHHAMSGSIWNALTAHAQHYTHQQLLSPQKQMNKCAKRLKRGNMGGCCVVYCPSFPVFIPMHPKDVRSSVSSVIA